MSFRNFYVLHRTVSGEPLDQSLVVGFSSSISSFTKTLLNESVREVTSLYGRVVYREVGDFILVAHCDLKVGSLVAQTIIKAVASMCEMLFGSPDHWDQDTFDLSGIQEIIGTYFGRVHHDPVIVSDGISQVPLESDITERLDKILSVLESQDGVCGNGTMLTLGESVMHSRMPLHDTRLILQYHKARPLGPMAVRYTPVYTGGAWRNLYTVRVYSYVLFVETFIDRPFTQIQKKVDEFQSALIQSRLEIPTEEPPVLLRLFAKRETLAMMYTNLKTGVTLFPALRPGPEVQQKEIMDSFWSFYSDASTSLAIPGVTEFSLVRDSYRFFARTDNVHRLYLLLSNESSLSDVPALSLEILKNLRAF